MVGSCEIIIKKQSDSLSVTPTNMARIYPENPYPDTSSNAEIKIFQKLKEELPADYVIFHSVAWQVRDSHVGSKDGEIDFLIISPKLDILLIEGKGGHIRREGDTGEWFSNNNLIKDPFRQVREAKYIAILNGLWKRTPSGYASTNLKNLQMI